MTERGKYIVIEGTDGTGKSTQVELLHQRLEHEGIKSIEFHEPGGTPIADEIRRIVKNGDLARDPETNLLLFTAARKETWKIAHEALKKGIWVISERNHYTTLAYQGYGEGLNTDHIMQITDMFIGKEYTKPDWTCILSLDDHKERARRVAERGLLENPDTFESKDQDFQQRISKAYLTIATQYNLPVISAAQSREAIANEIYIQIKTALL
jgi:dTMP kinase